MENHRSVIPGASKIFEIIIQNQISCHVNDFLSPFLCDRKSFSFKYALLLLIEKCKVSLDNKKYTGAVLINFSRALHTINHELLIATLHNYMHTVSLKMPLKYCLVISLTVGER